MKNRIKELRKSLGLDQTQFGKSLGLTQAAISGYETGIRVPDTQTILFICQVYNVSELWLRTGEGEMHNDVLPLDENALLIAQYIDDPDSPMAKAILAFLKVYDSYPDEKKPGVLDFIQYALDAYKNGVF